MASKKEATKSDKGVKAKPLAGPSVRPLVGIVMGSKSDYDTLKNAEEVLVDFGIPYEISVVSAHRMAEVMFAYGRSAEERGLKVIIAGAGGAAHLPGMLSALTTVPVLGVPVQSKALSGLDSLLSIVQMPAGVPTATFAIGTSGATNAGLFASQILALNYAALAKKVRAQRDRISAEAAEGNAVVQARLKKAK